MDTAPTPQALALALAQRADGKASQWVAVILMRVMMMVAVVVIVGVMMGVLWVVGYRWLSMRVLKWGNRWATSKGIAMGGWRADLKVGLWWWW